MLIGKKVYLRAIEPDQDIEKCFYWMNDREITKNLRFIPPLSRGTEKDWLVQASRHGQQDAYNFAIVSKQTDVYIGNCGLSSINRINRNAELGIFIGDRSHWGQGLGGDAIRELCRFGFKSLNLNRVYLHVYSFNERGVKCFTKAGFKQEGCLRSHKFTDGQYCDEIIMGMLYSEFKD